MREDRIYKCLFCGSTCGESEISWYMARSLEGCCKMCLKCLPEAEYWMCVEMIGGEVPDLIKRKYPEEF